MRMFVGGHTIVTRLYAKRKNSFRTSYRQDCESEIPGGGGVESFIQGVYGNCDPHVSMNVKDNSSQVIPIRKRKRQVILGNLFHIALRDSGSVTGSYRSSHLPTVWIDLQEAGKPSKRYHLSADGTGTCVLLLMGII